MFPVINRGPGSGLLLSMSDGTTERQEDLIEVKVFGAEPPCVKCRQSEQEARKAAARFPGQVTVEKLSALSAEGVAFGFVMTPAVVVNGKVISQGRVPQEAELERVLRDELGG